MRILVAILLILTGAAFAFQVTGNEAFSAAEIETAAYASGIFNADNILRFYSRAGYLDATVKVDKEDPHVVVEVAEGELYLLGSVEVQNDTPLTQAELRAYVTVGAGDAASPLAISEALESLLQYLSRRGYIRATASYAFYPLSERRLDLSIKLRAGPRFTVGDVTFRGPAPREQEELLPRWNTRAGKPFRERDLASDLLATIDYYRERGYANASARPRRFKLVTETAEVDFDVQVDPGARVEINKIEIRGNRRTRDYVIRRELTIAPGDPYDVKEIRRSARAAYTLKYFEDTPTFELVDGEGGTLRMEVAERPTYRATGALAYEPPEESTAGGLIGEIETSLDNLAGTGRNAGALYRRTSDEYVDAATDYYEPWIAGVDLFAQPEGYWRTRETYDKAGGEYAMGTHPGLDLTVAAGAGFDRVWRENASRKLKVFAWATWDTRDSFANPRRGWQARSRLELGVKDYFDDGFRERIPRLELDLWRFEPLARSQVLAGRLRAEGYVSKRDAADECYPLGGFADLRGYRNEHYLTDRQLLATVEYRFLTARESRVFAFADAAYYHRQRESALDEGLAAAYGAGFRARTPVGLYGVDYGLRFGASPLEGKLHVSITQDF